MVNQSSAFRLLNLSGEIRNVIYEFILQDFFSSASFYRGAPSDQNEDREAKRLLFSLLSLSRQMYAEVGSRLTYLLRSRILCLRDKELPILTRRLEQATQGFIPEFPEWQDNFSDFSNDLTTYKNDPTVYNHDRVSVHVLDLLKFMREMEYDEGATQADIALARSMREVLKAIEILVSNVNALEEMVRAIDCDEKVRRWAADANPANANHADPDASHPDPADVNPAYG